MLTYLMEIFALSHHIVLNLTDCLNASFLGGHKVAGRVNGDFIQFVDEGTCQWVDYRNLIYFVSEEFYSYCILSISDTYIHCISADSEGSSLEFYLCPAVECIHQLI